jgi:hypothetical protein
MGKEAAMGMPAADQHTQNTCGYHPGACTESVWTAASVIYDSQCRYSMTALAETVTMKAAAGYGAADILDDQQQSRHTKQHTHL